MADSRHLEKSKNCNISATDWPISTKFGKLTRNGTPERIDCYKLEFSKIQDGGGRHFEKPSNRDISATVWPIWTKFGMVTRVPARYSEGPLFRGAAIPKGRCWVMLRTSNLVGRLISIITACPSLPMTNRPWKGRGQGHQTIFRILHPMKNIFETVKATVVNFFARVG